MPRMLRDSDPEKIHMITTRTERAALWLIPTKEINEIIGGVIARYQEIFQIIIYAYIFTSNHYHMLLRAPNGRLDEFLESINREISRRINIHYKRRGKLWGRRYDDQIVLSEADQIEALTYIATNAVRHGLVYSSKNWPGLSSFDSHFASNDQKFNFVHHSKFVEGMNEFGKKTRTKLVTIHSLKISTLPALSRVAEADLKKLMASCLESREKEIRERRSALREGFLGADKVRTQKPGSVPRTVSQSSRPYCYTKCAALRAEFKKNYHYMRECYDEASRQYRLGNLEVEFPKFTFKPPIHRRPRILPFEEMKLLKAA